MAVYVDEAKWPYSRMIMCHMVADTPEELAAMADKIGVHRKWFQRKASGPHFDIAKSKRELAVAAGAVEVTCRKLVMEILPPIKQSWPRGPEGWLL